MRILVVDDEPAVRDSLRRALQLEGYDVELAADGQEALERIEGGNGVDALVLVDLAERRAAEIPDAYRELIRGFEGDDLEA